jgi:CO dehydrogenase/acetyl-CoA synthase gamma subunit (corrinoid Fe-S protein)
MQAMAQRTPNASPIHFLVFAPGLDAWVFQAAYRYWTVFKPILYTMRTPDDLALVTYPVEEGHAVAVTLVMRRDTASTVQAMAARMLPDAFLDPLVYDAPEDLRLTLDGRAAYNQRYGVPDPTPGGA